MCMVVEATSSAPKSTADQVGESQIRGTNVVGRRYGTDLVPSHSLVALDGGDGCTRTCDQGYSADAINS